ncbi:hypothetical protein PtA15_18A235 [Puccinia triticina]|uniref:RING-type domain-containing protein n=1 Tax=Puccinia triticina TaxID=208348 RepID=A0ABY7DDV5_9BASI|nr:uncharacterized protein PtA15_18A235 [Puccinia triticina]WAQ93177.1 hypothetical protein PtA15_18A235 [Puccinia triticina]WAR63150.1 hypothetical protein PtB15_18B232 [Puccinia triticina]
MDQQLLHPDGEGSNIVQADSAPAAGASAGEAVPAEAQAPPVTLKFVLRELAPFYSMPPALMGSLDRDPEQQKRVRDFLEGLPITIRVRRDASHFLELLWIQTRLVPQAHHPVVTILDSASPQWIALFTDELVDAVASFVDGLNERFRRLRLSESISRPTIIPPPAHLVSPNPPDGPASCLICLSKYSTDSQLIILRCNPNHHYHRSCLSRWVLKDTSCPRCRAQLQ